MLRLSKMTDYGTLLLAEMARHPDAMHSAAELSAATGVGAPTVSKLLKQLTRGGLLSSQRGANGGYALLRQPDAITAADIIDAIEGDVGITECSTDHSNCSLETNCNVGSAWQRINVAIRDALREVTLSELARPSQLRTPAVKLGGSLKNIPIKVE